MDKEIEVVNLFIPNIDGYLTTFLYTQDDGAYEAVTVTNLEADFGGKTITVGEDKADVLKRHTNAVSLEIEIQKGKGK
jgi:hypothetical protein